MLSPSFGKTKNCETTLYHLQLDPLEILTHIRLVSRLNLHFLRHNLLAIFCNLAGHPTCFNSSLCASYFYSKCIIKEAYFCVIHNIPKTKKWGKTNRKGARSRKQAIKQQNQRRKKKLICCCLRILWWTVNKDELSI